MAHLSIHLLGSLRVTLDERPVTDFKSNKVRALLAYLAVEADRPHRREVLAALLWPEMPDQAARSNLRDVLSNLRQVTGARKADPPLLLIDRDTVQFNVSSDHWLDVAAFYELVEVEPADQTAPQQLEEAVVLYRGGFLEGFSLRDSPTFEDWSLLTREQLQRQALMALRWLAGHYEGRGEYGRACDYAWRQVELEPWAAFSIGFDGALVQWQIADPSLAELLVWIHANRYVRDLTCEERAQYRVEPLCEVGGGRADDRALARSDRYLGRPGERINDHLVVRYTSRNRALADRAAAADAPLAETGVDGRDGPDRAYPGPGRTLPTPSRR